MSAFDILLYTIIGINVLLSFLAFNNGALFNDLRLNVYDVLQRKEYKRILTSGFIHVDILHLFFNMFVLYVFAIYLPSFLHVGQFLMIYLGSLLFGNIIALISNKHNINYNAVGASGAVSGIVYAMIVYQPFSQLLIYFIVPIPAWIFGILYLLYSMYGMRQKSDNIGHEAHLGGAIFGLITAVLFRPDLALNNWLIILLLFIPTVFFFIVLLYKPHLLGIRK